MASTPSSVSSKNNECGIINMHIFNITHFQNKFYLPQSTPTGNERCQQSCWWTWRRDEQRDALCKFESIVIGCGDPSKGYNCTDLRGNE
jgi:hypothetical protein